MRRAIILLFLSVAITAICITSCVHKPQVQVTPTYGNFPDSVGKIFLAKCTNAGCHNAASYQNAAELELDTWEHLFNGGISGAVVVAYSPTYSPLLYYINAYDSADVIAYDPGHIKTPLTPTEYATIKNWITNGAPDQNGNIPFASNPDTRQKIYLTNQGCDLLAVIDAKSRQVMRYITLGVNATGKTQTPHDVEISSDGMTGYVSLYDGSYLQKFDTRTDAITGNLSLSSYILPPAISGGWSILSFSPQDTALLLTGMTANSMISINTSSFTLNQRQSVDIASTGTSFCPYPHGIASNATFDTFFTALQYGNTVLGYTFKPMFREWPISVNGRTPNTTNVNDITSPNPHQIEMAPDYSRYFVTCQNTNVVSVINSYTNDTEALIPVGGYPQEMCVYTAKNYLFVACMRDFSNPAPPLYGSIYVIDYNTLQVVKVIYGDFCEPHDMAVDAQDGLLYIASRNADGANSIPSHHSTACGGTAGWYSVYDLNTLQPADNKRYEVTNDAYAISARFK